MSLPNAVFGSRTSARLKRRQPGPISRKLCTILVAIAWATTQLHFVRVAAETNSAPKPLPAPKHVVIPKLRGPVQIDGDLSEPVWTKAAWITPFNKNDGSGPEREPTSVRVWYDDTALYLGWTCRDTDIQATFTARDSHFWEEEVVEFFVSPKELTRYFELEWNPLGGVFDAIITNQLDANGVSKNFDGDWSYTARGMKSATKVKGTVGHSEDQDEFWQVEIMIPFSDLGQKTPKPGEIWRGNFYRFNRGRGYPVEELSWSPTLLPSFHQPSRFGYLEFGGLLTEGVRRPSSPSGASGSRGMLYDGLRTRP